MNCCGLWLVVFFFHVGVEGDGVVCMILYFLCEKHQICLLHSSTSFMNPNIGSFEREKMQ